MLKQYSITLNEFPSNFFLYQTSKITDVHDRVIE